MRPRKVIPNDNEPLTAEELKPLGKAFASRAGARIRELRKMQGLTLPEINERYGIGQGQVSRVENGKVDTTVATIVRLALALNVRPSDLYVPRKLNPDLRPRRRSAPLREGAAKEAIARFLEQLGARARELRTMQGFSLERLSEFAGMTTADLTIIEQGQRNLRASTIVRLADGLGVLPHELCIPSKQSRFRLKTKARAPRKNKPRKKRS